MSGAAKDGPPDPIINDGTGPVSRHAPTAGLGVEVRATPPRATPRAARVRVGTAWPAWGPDVRSGELDPGGGLSRQVLVRVRDLSPTSASGRAWLLRLRDTRGLLGAVPPPGVLNLLHSSPAGARIVEVYEGFRGASLATVLQAMQGANASLAVRLVVQIAGRVAQVAAGADRTGALVHPGITPESVLVDGRGELRVAGFLSRPSVSPPLASDDPLSSMWSGVPGYAPLAGPGAPGAGPMSIGALLLELLSGERPPPIEADRGKLRRLMVRAFARPNEVIPDDVIALVHECFTGTSALSLGAVAARLEAVGQGMDGPDYADWVQDTVAAVLTGRPLHPGPVVDAPSPMDGRFFTLHTNPGVPVPRRPPNLREGVDPEQEAATTIGSLSGAVEGAAPTGVAAAAPVVMVATSSMSSSPVAEGGPSPAPAAPGSVAAAPPAVAEVRGADGDGPGALVDRGPLSAAILDGGRTMLQPAPAGVNTAALTWLATSLVLLVTAIIVYLIVDRLQAAPASPPPEAPTATAIEVAGPASPLPSPAGPTVDAPSITENNVTEAVVPEPEPPLPSVAEPPLPSVAEPPLPSVAEPPLPSVAEPTAASAATSGGRAAAAPVQPPRMTPTVGEGLVVTFRAPDPAVDRMLVRCGDLRQEGQHEVRLSGVRPGECEVTVRRGPQSLRAWVQVSEARSFDCFADGGRDCL